MSDLAIDVATVGFVAVLGLLTWTVARSMRSQLRARPPGVPILVVTSGGRLEGLEIKVDRPVVIGRGTEADVRLTDDFASDAHTRLERNGAAVAVVDLGSTNGTFVNKTRVESRTDARRGDRVRIGRTIMEVQ